MTFDASTIAAWHDATSAAHVAKRKAFEARGYRPLSISLYGTPADPRYAAVMVRRRILVETYSFVDMSQSGYQTVFEEMANRSFGPFLITATGPRDGALFAGSFRRMTRTPLTRSNMSQQEFRELNAHQHGQGAILLWADCFGTPSDPRYCAIWGPNPTHVAWNIDALDEHGAAHQQRFEAMRDVGARPAVVAVTPSGGMMDLYVDSHVGPGHLEVGMTSAGYQAAFEAQTEEGRWPVCVSAAGRGDGARFAAVFATKELPDQRVFRARGTPAHGGIDAAMERYVRDQRVRGAALAIVQGQRLVHARAYTLAEPGYPDVEVTTPFRLASVSKTFAAVAAWRLIQDGAMTLDTTVQGVLGLTQPDGSAPADPRFGRITVGHLLTSCSGLDQGLVWSSREASAAAGGSLPSDQWEVARYAASRPLTGTPGDVSNTIYGNTDYLLLGLVVARRHGVPSFETALQQLVLGPLHMHRTRGSRSTAAAQAHDEARYHMTVHDPASGWKLFQLECAGSARHPDGRLVPTHHGGWDMELLDGCGGLSSAVVDVARLTAMFSCRSGTSVLQRPTIDAMLTAAVDATNAASGPDPHGYHGVDGAWPVDAANGRFGFAKGGWLPGTGTQLIAATGGLSYVLLQNGNAPAGPRLTWLDLVAPIAEAQDWGTTDRFPDFGMPSFPQRVPWTPPSPTRTGRVDVGDGAIETREVPLQRVAESMARGVRGPVGPG